MSDIAIKVENLSKKYIIGSGTNGSLRETLSNTFHNTFGGKRHDEEEFWALRDVSFEVKQGEAVGIIGRNGAGKSTLLKLLSKITYPTGGKIIMNGRVSSLLEVGTGFHPELTGRENIYLNGTILGMSRKEVKSKFDEIVDFSGVEKFLDTPVKRYSSGMYVRLAFAVAAHLEPEILIIDEVLAVGDAEFQKKCLGKMDEVAKGGRTVLFVSHNMGAIKALCTKAMLLSKGSLLCKGQVKEVIKSYIGKIDEEFTQEMNLIELERVGGLGELKFEKIVFDKPYYESIDDIVIGIKLKLVNSMKNNKTLQIALHVINDLDQVVYHMNNKFLNVKVLFEENKVYFFKIKKNALVSGIYKLGLRLFVNGIEEDYIRDKIPFKIEEGNIYNYPNSLDIGGLVQPDYEFFIS